MPGTRRAMASVNDQDDERLPADDRDYVQSLVRGLQVIRAFSREHPVMTLSEVAQQTDMRRATARRFLLTLVRANYAATDGKHFWLLPKVLDLGFAYMSSMSLWEIAEPIMRDVVAQTGESCSASILDGHEIVYITRVPTARVMTVGLSVGSRLPAFCSSMGRVMIAGLPPEDRARFLSEVKMRRLTPFTVSSMVDLRGAIDTAGRQGWAIVDQEIEVGLRSLAVPVRNRMGETVAAINMHVQVGRMSVDQMRETLLPVLLDASQRITAALTD